MEAQVIPEGIKISRKLRSDPSVWLLDRSQCYSQKHKCETNWRDFTYLSNHERMLNVSKKIEHNVVMNVKRLIDQVTRYWVKRWKSKLRARVAS
jgi:hypothetical protein